MGNNKEETKLKIYEVIMRYCDEAYCYNCEFQDDESEYTPCEYCHRKNNGWSLSKTTANVMVKEIMEVVNV